MPGISQRPIQTGVSRESKDIENQLPSRGIELNGIGQAKVDLDKEGLAEESSGEKWQRVWTWDTVRKIGTALAVDARLFRSVYLGFGEFYPFMETNDDAVVYNPTFWTVWSLASLKMVYDTITIIVDQYRGNADINNNHIVLEMLETFVMTIYIADFVREMQGKEYEQNAQAFLITIAGILAVAQVISDVKGELFSAYGHGAHRLAYTKASKEPATGLEKVINFLLRTNPAQSVILLSALMDVFDTLPLDSNYFLDHSFNSFLWALPLMIAYEITSKTLAMGFRAERLPPYLSAVAATNAWLQTLTIGSLAYISAYAFAVLPQLFADDQYNGLYIRDQPLRYWLTEVVLPSVVATFAAWSALKDHHVNFNQRIDERAHNNIGRAKQILSDKETVADWVNAETPATPISRLSHVMSAVSNVLDALTQRVERQVDPRASNVFRGSEVEHYSLRSSI